MLDSTMNCWGFCQFDNIKSILNTMFKTLQKSNMDVLDTLEVLPGSDVSCIE